MAELAEFVSFDNGTLASCVAASNWLLLETESFTFKSSLSTDPSLSRSPSNTLCWLDLTLKAKTTDQIDQLFSES